MPDFVIDDTANEVTIAGEFKPPNQSKREYLTGLGQAVAYTRDFDYAVLVMPHEANDGYEIGEHVVSVLTQPEFSGTPVGVALYDARTLSVASPMFELVRAPTPRTERPSHRQVRLDQSFWAKWRDMSPMELGAFLNLLYEEGRRITDDASTVRERAFLRLWQSIQRGELNHWSGGVRRVADSPRNRTAWFKNYRNFVHHLGWIYPNGRLTETGLAALQILHQFGSGSQVFVDLVASTLLRDGKHLVLMNAINAYQDSEYDASGPFHDESAWLAQVEGHLEGIGLLKRNPERHEAAQRGVARGFLKAEKTIWKNLGLIVPAGVGARVFHEGRGFVFNWSRITALIDQT